ncbi:hypothetical protein WJX73_002507 [Symbiochloris irregularis]|uniref:Pre-rRNA-processing protein TSR2 n=1 Tax=Symbiochloris irregularis TaxID=706552 RepID=A0AAW1NXG9_9CHLO
MQLRSGSVVGGSSGALSGVGKELFEEGVAAVFHRWTALCLAISEQWGGLNSAEKAEDLYTEVINWFSKDKVHHADDLEGLMVDQLLVDFNAQIEDGSTREVAKSLVALHHDLMQGKTSILDSLRDSGPSGASASQRQQVDLDGQNKRTAVIYCGCPQVLQ